MSDLQVRRASGDDGSVLTIALVFLIVGGLVIAGLLSQTEVNLKTTSIVKSRAERLYAADAAIESGIQQLRLNQNACSAAGGPTTLSAPTVNGKNVTLKCTPTFGSDLDAGGYAAIVHGTLSRQSGSGEIIITGPVFTTGDIDTAGNSPLTVQNGNVLDKYSSCPGHAAPSSLTVKPSPPYSWQCTTSDYPVPAHVLPAKPAPQLLTGGLQVGNCRVFAPGTYTSAPVLDTQNGHANYFISGVYYFENIGQLTASIGTVVIGGTPASGTPQLTDLATSCPGVSDLTQIGGATVNSGNGVEWIFGGNSSLEVDNNTAVELFERVPAAGQPETPGITFVAVAPDIATGGYAVINVVGPVLNVVQGGAGLAVRGMGYGPTADFDLFASQGAVAAFQAGLVTNNLVLQASTAGTGLTLSITVKNNVRKVLMTATAPVAGGGDVAADARLQIENTVGVAATTIVIDSWRTCTKSADASLPIPACP